MIVFILLDKGHGENNCKQEAQRATYRAPEYNVPPFWQIGQGVNFYLLIGLKNTNLVVDIEILLSVQFLWIPFSGFRVSEICCLKSHATISVIYVTAHRCAGGLKKLNLWSGSQRHRHFVGFFKASKHRHGPPFFISYSEKPSH